MLFVGLYKKTILHKFSPSQNNGFIKHYTKNTHLLLGSSSSQPTQQSNTQQTSAQQVKFSDIPQWMNENPTVKANRPYARHHMRCLYTFSRSQLFSPERATSISIG